LADALKVGLENMPQNLVLQQTLTGHCTACNIVSILSVQQTAYFMFAHLKIPLCYYDISCHNATQCHSSLSFECWCGFLMMAVNSRNMQRRIDVMYMYCYVQVVGLMN